MQIDPKPPVIRSEAQPLRDAADIMMDAIAGHFARRGDLPQLVRAPDRRGWLVRVLLAITLGLVSVAALVAFARSQLVVLPDLTGANVTQAKDALLDAGVVVTMRSQSSTLVRAHHVIDQTPPAGSWLRKGATVVLTASTGLPRVAAPHHRTAAKPNAHAPAVASTAPHALAAAPRTASTPGAKRPTAVPADAPFGVRSVGPVRFFSSASCKGDNLAVEIHGLSTGCTAFAIASTGKLLHGAGSGLVIPVTSINRPGEVSYGLMYVTPLAASRHFFGVLYGNSTGHLIVSVHNGLFEAQNGSHARYVTVGAASTPAPAQPVSDTREAPKDNCKQRSWLQKTAQHVFAPRSPDCN